MWRGLSSWARIRLSVAVTLESFNQGISIDPVLVRQLADREMQLDIDFYAGDENETERHGPRGPKLRLVPRKKSRDLSYRAAMDALTRTAHAKRVPLLGREPMPMTADYADAVRNHRFDLLYVEGKLAAPIRDNPEMRPPAYRERGSVSPLSRRRNHHVKWDEVDTNCFSAIEQKYRPSLKGRSITTHYFGNTCARRCSLGSSPGAVFSRAVMRAIAVTP
jgi:hypothetical protein